MDHQLVLLDHQKFGYFPILVVEGAKELVPLLLGYRNFVEFAHALEIGWKNGSNDIGVEAPSEFYLGLALVDIFSALEQKYLM